MSRGEPLHVSRFLWLSWSDWAKCPEVSQDRAFIMLAMMPVGNKQEPQVALAGVAVKYTAGWDVLVHSAGSPAHLCSELVQPLLPSHSPACPSLSYLFFLAPSFLPFLSSSASGTQVSKPAMLAKMVETFTSVA